MVEERGFPGHVGTIDDTPAERLGLGSVTHDGVINNPGGLTAVWAEERSRGSIFAAMKRREVYATSGPRIEVRLFGGWQYGAALCGDPERIARAYENGVPMGGDLPTPSGGGSAPTFLVAARADSGTTENPGTPLQRVQVIKGWLDASGEVREQVYEVAGEAEGGATVDLETCQPQGAGFDELCTVWSDPEFDPGQLAFYYARVVENPSCRWSRWECMSLPANEQPAVCSSDSSVPKTVQERAWTTPIWYTPTR